MRRQDLALTGHPDRPNKTIDPEIERAYAQTRLRGGEILVCVVGSIGKLGIVPQSWAGANIARAVARIMPIPEILREYLTLLGQGWPMSTSSLGMRETINAMFRNGNSMWSTLISCRVGKSLLALETYRRL